MVVETMIVGLRGADWEGFKKYLNSEEWKAALKSGSTEHVLRAVRELDLEEEKLAVAVTCLGARFKKSSYYSPGDIFETNPSMNQTEYENALEAILQMLDRMKNFNIRYLLFETLRSALEARPFSELSDNSFSTLINGLKEEPKIAIRSAEILSEIAEHIGNDNSRKGRIISALEVCAKRMEKSSEPSVNSGKILDAIERINYGVARYDTDYRRYLGDGELLRVPMFSSRPVPNGNPAKQPKIKENV